MEDRFEEYPCGAYRGLMFAIFFNILVVACGGALWLILR